MKKKYKLILTSIIQKVTEFGRTMRNWILIKTKHSTYASMARSGRGREDFVYSEMKFNGEI